MGRQAGTPLALADTAKALFNLAQEMRLREARQPLKDIENAFLAAAETWQHVGTPDGQVEAARALIGVGIAYDEANRPIAEAEDAFRRAAEAGRRSGYLRVSCSRPMLYSGLALPSRSQTRRCHG